MGDIFSQGPIKLRKAGEGPEHPKTAKRPNAASDRPAVPLPSENRVGRSFRGLCYHDAITINNHNHNQLIFCCCRTSVLFFCEVGLKGLVSFFTVICKSC